MLQPFTPFFSFLHRKSKSLLNLPKPAPSSSCCSCWCWRRRRPRRKFSPSFDFDEFSASFIDMNLSRQFQQVFKLIDSNGDGKISTTELSETLLCLGYNKCMAKKEAERMVRALDFNGDGFVDFDEFMVVMREGIATTEEEEEGGKNNNNNNIDQDEYLMDAFHVFDSDKNGLISAKELRRVLVNLGCDRCSIRECKRMIKSVDKNGDGFVDFDEFRSMMKKGLSKSKQN
ncbi:calcium-binding protein CML24-like [Arachis stenosperma]|uniref:calcium-binding protein CML24-like n=1 Tax=Arachis stenosperma TaxID=217475 RepID=UPI0025AD2D74|nr:calcium-binding protein CML24-like [Arachis stenosperma]